MKCIIAGSRKFPSLGLNSWEDWNNYQKRKQIYEILEECIEQSEYNIDSVVSGECWGIDKLGEEWAWRNDRVVYRFPADWRTHGKAAGPIRNEYMANFADCLICICTKDSKGSKNMRENMDKLYKPFFIKYIN